MKKTHTTDLIVIGAGPGGYVAALRAAQLGLGVVCVDKRETLGGTCLNVGCIPSKALLHASHQYEEAQDLGRYGIEIGTLSLDLGKMMANKDKIVEQLTQGIDFLFRKNKITRLTGEARIVSPETVEITTREGKEIWQSKKILIATGSEPVTFPGFPLDETRILSSTGALALKQVPKKMIVVGGGYIGLEMGSVWQRLGSQVTVLEFTDRLVPLMDHELGFALQKSLTAQGLTFAFSTQATSFKETKTGLLLESSSGTWETDVILMAVGRRPLTEGLGLADLGVRLDDKGFIQVNASYETSVPGLYAIGDVIPGPMLAHKAEEEGVVAVERMAGQGSSVNYDLIPSVIYTSPEVASVGKTEEELKQAGVSYKVGKFPFLANSRAKAIGKPEGFVKILADSRTDRVLGVHIFGQEAGTLIGQAVMAMEFSASSEDIARTCHAHPTLNEALKEAALAVSGAGLHI